MFDITITFLVNFREARGIVVGGKRLIVREPVLLMPVYDGACKEFIPDF